MTEQLARLRARYPEWTITIGFEGLGFSARRDGEQLTALTIEELEARIQEVDSSKR